MNNQLQEFLIKAKKETYANSEAEKINSSRTGSRDYEYRNGNMVYHELILAELILWEKKWFT